MWLLNLRTATSDKILGDGPLSQGQLSGTWSLIRLCCSQQILVVGNLKNLPEVGLARKLCRLHMIDLNDVNKQGIDKNYDDSDPNSRCSYSYSNSPHMTVQSDSFMLWGLARQTPSCCDIFFQKKIVLGEIPRSAVEARESGRLLSHSHCVIVSLAQRGILLPDRRIPPPSIHLSLPPQRLAPAAPSLLSALLCVLLYTPHYPRRTNGLQKRWWPVSGLVVPVNELLQC